MRHPQPGALPTMVTHIALGPGVFCGQVDIPGTWDFQLQNCHHQMAFQCVCGAFSWLVIGIGRSSHCELSSGPPKQVDLNSLKKVDGCESGRKAVISFPLHAHSPCLELLPWTPSMMDCNQ